MISTVSSEGSGLYEWQKPYVGLYGKEVIVRTTGGRIFKGVLLPPRRDKKHALVALKRALAIQRKGSERPRFVRVELISSVEAIQ
ncbi:MAG: hypothetical protein QXU98_07260 [Candidatus Parvarchaeota archaeon]